MGKKTNWGGGKVKERKGNPTNGKLVTQTLLADALGEAKRKHEQRGETLRGGRYIPSKRRLCLVSQDDISKQLPRKPNDHCRKPTCPKQTHLAMATRLCPEPSRELVDSSCNPLTLSSWSLKSTSKWPLFLSHTTMRASSAPEISRIRSELRQRINLGRRGKTEPRLPTFRVPA